MKFGLAICRSIVAALESVVMSAVFTPTRARLTVAQFQKMGDAGIMPPETRVELVDGELIEMAPIGPRHMQAVNRLTRALVAAVGKAAIVSVQNPVALGEHSETQPDLALLGPQSDSETRLPTPDDVLLLVEVADTTLQYDRTTKLALYARFGVREVWIVNLIDHILEIHREPYNGAYRVKLERGGSDAVAPVALPNAEVHLAEIW
jgi:Uma2 family endonuclease